MENRENPPKVFISYSWSSVEHQNFVLHLAEKLMGDGVIVIFDKWDLKEGQDKYVFMEKMVTDSTIYKVLVISDKKYGEKADKRKGGVGTETQIISDEIYQKVEQNKFIPIVTEFDPSGEPYLPTFMKSRLYINLSSDEVYYSEYEKLLRVIYDKPAYPKPLLGIPPSFIYSDVPQTIVTIHKFQTFRDAIVQNKPSVLATSQEYLDTLSSAFDLFKIEHKTGEIDDEIIDSIRNFKPYRDQFVEFVKLVCSYGNSHIQFEQIFSFIEKSIRYFEPLIMEHSYYPISYDNYKFIIYELALYIFTLVIKYQKYDELNYFLSEKYYVKTPYQRSNVDFTHLNSSVESLDVYRKQRLKLNRISITADLIKDRCDFPGIEFEDIMQTDFLVFIRSIIGQESLGNIWSPVTLVYKTHHEGPFELFMRAESPRQGEKLCKILNAKSMADFITKFEEAYKSYNLGNFRFDIWPIPFASLINLAKLRSIYTA